MNKAIRMSAVLGAFWANWAEASPGVAVVELEYRVGQVDLIDGEPSRDTHYEALKNRADVVILKVKNAEAGGGRRPLLWQRGFREADVRYDGVLLPVEGTSVFVLAPVTMEDAWKRVEAELATKADAHAGRLLLSYARFYRDTERARAGWEFMFGLKDADGGLLARFDLAEGKVSFEGAP